MNQTHYEIERKFLIRMPDTGMLARQNGYGATQIEQIYLSAPEGVTERVRKRGHNGAWVYTHTIKRAITSVRREEDEREIDRAQYEALMLRKRPGTRIIVKTRHVFTMDGQVYEIDVYPFWADRAVLETEIEDEETPVVIPPFLTLIREVTDERAYTNAALAERIPME